MDAGFLIHFFAREGGLGRVGGEIPRDSITILTKCVTTSPLIWLYGGTNFEFQKVLKRLPILNFQVENKTKTKF